MPKTFKNKGSLRATRKRPVLGKQYPRPALRGTLSKLTAVRSKKHRGVTYVRRSNAIKPHYVLSTGDMSRSMFKLSRPASKQVKAIERIGAPNTYINQTVDVNTASHGFQQPHSLSLFNLTDLFVMGGNGPSAVIPTDPNIQRPTRFVIESCQGEYTFSNMSTGGVDLEIYDLVLKRDLPTSNSVTVNTQTYPISPYPDLYWNEGSLAVQGQPTGTTPSPCTILGSSPFDSPFFKDYFKVMKRTIVQLKQGSAHRHAVWLQPNSLIDNTVWQNSAVTGVRGITSFMMYNIRGLPVGDTAGHTTTTGQCQVNCVLVKRYKYTWVANNTYNSLYRDSLTSPVAGSIVNVGSGAIGPDSTVGV